MKKSLFISLALLSAPMLMQGQTIEINGRQRAYSVLATEQPAPGVTYNRLRFTDPDYLLNVNLITVDLSNPGNRVQTWCANESAKGIEAITSAASRMTSEELTPVAAANGNFWHCYGQNEYPTYNYIPRVLSIRNGMLVTELNAGTREMAQRSGT